MSAVVTAPAFGTPDPVRISDGSAASAASSQGPGLESLDVTNLAGPLPAEAERELRLASLAYPDHARAERHLVRAGALAPEHPFALIGLYRFYFYSNRLEEALDAGLRCLDEGARANRLPADWRQVRPEQAPFDTYLALPRFYLFSLKACAYLRLRLGDLSGGMEMLDKLTALDPQDKVNGSVLRGVLDRMGGDDDE